MNPSREVSILGFPALGYMIGVLLAACIARPAVAQCTGCTNASFGPAGRAYSSRLPGISPGQDQSVTALAVADFDNDGIPDVVTTGGFLLFFRGTGAGSFEAPTQIPGFGSRSSVMIAADFDRDGNMDIAVPGAVILGDGHGGFTEPLPMPLSGDRMVAGDFDGDGILDVAMLDYQSGLTILHGVGDGTFVIGATLIPDTETSGPPQMLLRSADFNRDGISDIVVATPSDGTVDVILGSRDGNFVVKPLASPPSGIVDLAVADFNNDGKPDLVIAGVPGPYQTYSLFVFPGIGDGTFAKPLTTPTSYYGVTLTIGDFDNDGKLDLVVQGADGRANEMAIYPGKGNGAFREPRITRSAGGGLALTAADVHRDGMLDLVLPSNENYFTVLAGTGDGYFAEPPIHSSPTGIFGSMVVTDLNGDGTPDLVGTGGALSTLFGDGNGGFSPPTTYSVQPFGPVVIGDFNGDGKADVAVSSYNGFLVLLNQGNGTLGTPILTMSDPAEGLLAAGDFDGDGKLDLIVYTGTLSLYRGLGNGSFQSPSTIATLSASSIVAADVNGDGKPDLLALSLNVPSRIQCFLNQGNGTFAAPVVTVLSDNANSFAVGDFDEDGKLDIVVQYSNPGSVGLLFGDKTGSFASEKVFSDEDFSRTVTTADINGDGHLDVVSTGAQIAVLTGTGTGTLRPALLFAAQGSPLISGVGDFNRDGKPDIAVASVFYPQGDGHVQVLTNTGCEPRRLGVGPGIAVCTPPAAPLSLQPVVTVYDDGDNVVSCDAELVTASIASRTGTSGAVLGGTKTITADNGVAAFSNLSIDRAGTGYKLEFHHPTAAPSRTSAFDIGGPPKTPAASNNGPICSGQTLQLQTPMVVRGIYHWTGPNGLFSTLQNPIIPNVTSAAAGLYNLTVEVDGCESGEGSTTVVVQPSIITPITAPASACPYAGGYVASVPDAGPGATYSWSISNGTITAGAGTSSITFSAGKLGQVALSVLVTASAGCSMVTAAVDIENTCGMSFYTLPPCRVVETRNPTGPYGAPALAGFSDRDFILSGQCGIPPTAFAVSTNVTVTQSTQPGDLLIRASGTSPPVPFPWVITYSTGQTRANNAILSLGTSGDITVFCDQFYGTVQFILDVNGYFQ